MAVTNVWDNSVTSLLHGEENNIFKGNWTYDKDFDNLTWIKSIVAEYTVSSGLTVNSQCQIYIQYSKDRLSWSNWIIVPQSTNLVENPLFINELVYGLKFKIILSDGWDGSISTPPIVKMLKYYSVTPATKYYITPAFSNTGMLFEYILSATANLPKAAKLRWGIVRGNSTDFSDFEIVANGKKGVLPNRQSGIKYTNEIRRENLKATMIVSENNSAYTYQVYETNNIPAQWVDTDLLEIYVNTKLVDSKVGAYSLDGRNGKIYFAYPIPTSSTVIVNIITPEQVISFDGEPTWTRDYRTYYASNGGWTKDASIIVLINNNIIRGGYWTSADDGIITFDYELMSTDVVSIFIQYSPYFRVGVEVTNYDENNDVVLDIVGLYYTELNNSNLIGKFNNTPLPSISGKPVIKCANNSLYSRMLVEYNFISNDTNGYMKEQNSSIEWYRNGSGYNAYSNRTTQPKSDVWVAAVSGYSGYSGVSGYSGAFSAGDQVYVVVTPSDGDNFGNPVSGYAIILQDNVIPSVWDAVITCNSVVNSKFRSVTVDSSGYLLMGNVHGFVKNEEVGFTGILPTGLSINTKYYVILDETGADNSFKRFFVSSEIDGTKITLTQTARPFSAYTYLVYIPVGEPLYADYKYNDPKYPSDTTDINNLCKIVWYLNDGISGYSGRNIPKNTTKTGQSLTFSVEPPISSFSGYSGVSGYSGYSGEYGYKILSPSVEIK